jgi:hypothetical protein
LDETVRPSRSPGSVEEVLGRINKRYLETKARHVPPLTLLGRAVSYALSEWDKLLRYLGSSELTPDTSLVGYAIRHLFWAEGIGCPVGPFEALKPAPPCTV